VHTELANELPHVLGDRIQLQQVIFNLVNNAIDAMRSVKDRPHVLRIASAIHQSASVQVVVEDSGTGIDSKIIDRIFDPFYTTKSHGMGMGLSICRSIVEAHRGLLLASSQVGHGSIFRVVLPKAPRAYSGESGR
jgi:signal transduction histidine kinase